MKPPAKILGIVGLVLAALYGGASGVSPDAAAGISGAVDVGAVGLLGVVLHRLTVLEALLVRIGERVGVAELDIKEIKRGTPAPPGLLLPGAVSVKSNNPTG